MSNPDFLPDGGMAFAAGNIKLPRCIFVTDLTIHMQVLKEVQPGRTLIQCEIFGHMWAFLVALKPDKVRAHIEQYAVLGLTNFQPGLPQTALITGEKFRDVLCDSIFLNNKN